jgi:hypothetical protein
MSACKDDNKSWIAMQKYKGPRGSPCCAPSAEGRLYSPNCSLLSSRYELAANGSSSGSFDAIASRILSLLSVLNALVKSNLIKT